MRLRRPLPAVQGDTLHIVGVGDNRIGKEFCFLPPNLLNLFGKNFLNPLNLNLGLSLENPINLQLSNSLINRF